MTSVSLSQAQSALAEALAAPGATRLDLFAQVAQILRDHAGCILVTVSSIDPDDHSAERLFSTDERVYPVGGRKPANVTDWSRIVMQEQQIYVANDYVSMSETMFDHETIKSLGCESITNLPLVLFGKVIGTLNCLGPAGNFTPENLQICKDMRLPVLLGLLAPEA